MASAESMTVAKLRRALTGTWLLPAVTDHQTTMTLLGDSSMRMIVASASTKERLRQIASGDLVVGNWRVDQKLHLAAGGRLLSSVAGSSGSSFRPPLARGKPGDAPRKGPFLILNVTDLPKALANVTLFGLRFDLANWVVGLDELRGSYYFKLIAASDDGERLEVADAHGVRQTWERVQ